MDKMVESSSSSLSPSETLKLALPEDQNTPPVSNQESNLKPGAPDKIIVPKAFKNPERYTSPTDKMMSPVTRGILARNRKGRRLLPPSAANQPKIQVQPLQLAEAPPLN